MTLIFFGNWSLKISVACYLSYLHIQLLVQYIISVILSWCQNKMDSAKKLYWKSCLSYYFAVKFHIFPSGERGKQTIRRKMSHCVSIHVQCALSLNKNFLCLLLIIRCRKQRKFWSKQGEFWEWILQISQLQVTVFDSVFKQFILG